MDNKQDNTSSNTQYSLSDHTATQPITVTSPLLPDLEQLIPMLKDIWSSKWITNMGSYHERLEQALADYLGVEYISLFTNGTLPLITAFQALGLNRGEVITTPFSFVATTHSILWNGLKPVFVDIDPKTGNIDPEKIEQAITPETVAIMPVHVYGCPCDTERIDELARRHRLKVIYDAAHVFGVRNGDGSSVLQAGDISTVSFHATKVFNTIEGGALICRTKEMKQKIDHLKNFGFEDEVTVVAPGINSKMDEVRSAYGLINLQQVDTAISKRKHTADIYTERLKNAKGIRLFPYMTEPTFKWNYAYYPIFVEAEEYGMSRDELYQKLRANGILGRRYFYPLISTFEPYRHYPSASADNLPIATRLAQEVICLPMHHNLTDEEAEKIINVIVEH